ncbi:hypothetical protein CC1G_03092 [Coprinopsis cinerea okayama7|uniref:BTB domain-containing protein n=1 Tax=Coprinopsis cinerea (strain Okayama-7 / 130 / ATCC MYA-4618 / FGSC 9003) TaxID=240176 RepID=A8PEW8_COPC7|nr:hypothetical protein CC1G_03092 [Coprinopsis cinerea okayama7\|eukprot:XP_001840863.2 hypothetical protein CC1G_03092 [Coprinopsis cinerea okayama7\
MSEPGSSRKRPRTNDDAPVSDNSIQIIGHTTRNQKLWFQDGNVVLQVEGVQFRVHRGILERHSNVLHGMFFVPQPEPVAAAQETTIEGCPVVTLWDSSRDWEELLQYIYDGFLKRRTHLTFPLIRAMIVLGHKYEFDTLKEEGLTYLSQVYPPSYTALNSTERKDKLKLFYTDDTTFIDAVNLALEHNHKRFLPALFLAVLTHTQYPEILTNGLADKTGRIVKIPAETAVKLAIGHEKLYEGMLKHPYGHLTGKTTSPRGCFRALGPQSTDSSSSSSSDSDSDSTDSDSSDSSDSSSSSTDSSSSDSDSSSSEGNSGDDFGQALDQAMDQAIAQRVEQSIRARLRISPCESVRLEMLKDLVAPPVTVSKVFSSSIARGRHAKLCSNCLEYGAARVREGQRKLWEELPTYFGLPPWKQLEQEQEQA